MALTEVRNGQYVKYRAGDAEITAYFSEPTTPGPHPAMLVIQPVHGMTPRMEVFADQLAARGYVALALRIGYAVNDARASIEALSWKVGLVLLVLGGMHFFNLLVFSRIRGRARDRFNPLRPGVYKGFREETDA